MLACAPSLSVISRVQHSRTLVPVLAVATAMVLLRAAPYLMFGHLAFDSDQAIVGLMAKHLTERRAFPLFFYGQTYMLAVEAWAAAPFFAIAGPGVTSLRVSILLWNVAFVWLLIIALRRDSGLGAWWTLVPASLIALTPPSVATQLMAAQGGIVEPFVWIVALWMLRERPLWFGVVLAIGFRNREFTAYAVPALLVVELVQGSFNQSRLREWLSSAVMFAIVWQAIEALKPYADLYGPGTRGQLLDGFAGSQLTNLLERSDFDRGALLERSARLFPEIFRWFAGAAQIDTALPIGSRTWLAWPAAALSIGLAAWLVLLLVRKGVRARTTGFAIYLIVVGAAALMAFVASKPVLVGYSRYALLGLVLPVGAVAGVLSVEESMARRRVLAAVIALWTLFAAVDHTLVAVRYIHQPLPNESKAVADQLIADRTPSAIAGYWQAYLVTFMSLERVRVASNDFVRIKEYQDEFERHTGNGVTLSQAPCPGGRRVGSVYICAS